MLERVSLLATAAWGSGRFGLLSFGFVTCKPSSFDRVTLQIGHGTSEGRIRPCAVLCGSLHGDASQPCQAHLSEDLSTHVSQCAPFSSATVM